MRGKLAVKLEKSKYLGFLVPLEVGFQRNPQPIRNYVFVVRLERYLPVEVVKNTLRDHKVGNFKASQNFGRMFD